MFDFRKHLGAALLLCGAAFGSTGASAATVIAGQIGGCVEEKRACHGLQSHCAAVPKQSVIGLLNQFGRVFEPYQPRKISMQGLAMLGEQLRDVVSLR